MTDENTRREFMGKTGATAGLAVLGAALAQVPLVLRPWRSTPWAHRADGLEGQINLAVFES